MIKMKYLSQRELEGFDRYKYNSIDTSILSVYVMHPFWNYCVQYFPRWLAPNLITFFGFILTVVNFLLIGYYDYGFLAADDPNPNVIPNWVFLVAAVNIFLAYTLDGIDGKQARRTGTSGPLGELFDHGLDSYSAVLIPIYIFSLFGRHDLPTFRMHWIIWLVFLNFYLTHFEKYNTRVMFLPWGYDFTMWGVTITLCLTCFCGMWIWKAPISLGFLEFAPARVFEFLMYTSAILTNFPVIGKNIYLSYKNKTGKMRPFMEAVRPMFAFFALFCITTTWVYGSHNEISNLEPRLLFCAFGTIFSNICCRLIVAQMTDTRVDGWNFLLWPTSVCALIFTFPYYLLEIPMFSPQFEVYTVYALCIISTIVHLHYGYGIVREMCDYFKIKCFKVRDMGNKLTNNNNLKSH